MERHSGLRLKMVAALAVRAHRQQASALLEYLPDHERGQVEGFIAQFSEAPDPDYAVEQLIRQLAAAEHFVSLAEIHPAWFLEHLRAETPRVIGLILRSLPGKHLRYVLEKLPPMLRAQIPNLVESFAVSQPVLAVIRSRFERRFLPMRISRSIEHPQFEHLYFLRIEDLSTVIRELGLLELAIALSGMSGKALHIIYNRLDLKDAKRLQRRIKTLSGISPELHRQARYNLLEIEGQHEGAERMLISVGLAALACAADEHDQFIRLLMQKLEPAQAYFLRRCRDARRLRPQPVLAAERRELILATVAQLAREARIDPQWTRFASEAPSFLGSEEGDGAVDGAQESSPDDETGSAKLLD